MPDTLYTIGHSNHPLERFLDLLRLHRIDIVGDVRSSPYSRRNPQFNREPLQERLRQAGVAYRFFGAALGARCPDPSCSVDGRVRFSLVAKTPVFRNGLDQVRAAVKSDRMALMCAEQDPLQCHRTMLICRNLRNEPFPIAHILADGSLETQDAMEERLLKLVRIEQDDLFLGREELIEQAYDLLSDKMTGGMQERKTNRRKEDG